MRQQGQDAERHTAAVHSPPLSQDYNRLLLPVHAFNQVLAGFGFYHVGEITENSCLHGLCIHKFMVFTKFVYITGFLLKFLIFFHLYRAPVTFVNTYFSNCIISSSFLVL